MKNTATILLMAIRVLVFGAWVFHVRDGYFATLWISGSFAIEFVLFLYTFETQRRNRAAIMAQMEQAEKTDTRRPAQARS